MADGWDGRPGYTVECGAVGEWCRRCDAVRLFVVEERRVDYVFLVWKLGTSRVARRVICDRCGDWKYLSGFARAYAEWVPVAEAERMSLAKLVRRTNPILDAELD